MITRVLAALAFSVLVGLCVATAALRIASLRARARLENLRLELQALEFETISRRQDLVRACELPRLRAALQQELEGHREE